VAKGCAAGFFYGLPVEVDTVKRLWTHGLKLIVVTYCYSPDEQARVYDRIHEICV